MRDALGKLTTATARRPNTKRETQKAKEREPRNRETTETNAGRISLTVKTERASTAERPGRSLRQEPGAVAGYGILPIRMP